jgi:hypothetical protein
MLRLAAILALIAPLLSGCFTYATVQPSALTPDMNVRARLVEDDREETVEGKVFEVVTDALSILPEVTPGSDGRAVSLAFDDIDLLEQRTLSPARTLLVLGTSIAIGVAALFAVNIDPGGETVPGGGVVFQRIPLIRFVLGR